MWPQDVLLGLPSQRLAQTLLHFLWQGALLAAVYSVAIEWVLRRPKGRYAAGVIALAVMAACLPITYTLIELPADDLRVDGERSLAQPFIAPENHAESQAFASTIDANLTPQFGSVDAGAWQQAETETDGLELASGQAALYRRIVLVWLIGVVAFSLRLVGGAIGLRLLARHTSSAAAEYVSLMERLGRAMRLGRLPRLVVSSRVSEAIASGFFRPVIVFPAAWLAELPPAVIEAVLAHELAHVRRYDLWVNLLQRTLEAVLFFHPAVWWISRQVRSDREMCCDEMAVAATGQKVAYVSALEVVARRAGREPLFSLATGIGGRKMQLLERVRYVLGLPAQRQPGGWWAAGVLALAVPCGLWALTGPAAPLALAQEEREEGERDREERDADREREDREEQDEREDEDNEAREARERDRAERARDRAIDAERREIEIRRRRELREQGDRPRREGERDAEFDREVRRELRARDPGPQASVEAQIRRAEQQAQQAEQRAREQVRRALERERQSLERRMAEARERLGNQVRGAEERGEKERVEALRREMEAMQREAEDQVRGLEKQMEDLVAQQRKVQQGRAEAERGRAEQLANEARMQMRMRSEGADPQSVREMAAAVKALREEVQQLRREVRELREGAPRKDPPRKDPEPKGEASLILKAVPYVGRLFPDEKQIKKSDPKPKVSVKLDDQGLESGRLKLEMKLQGKDLENLNKDLEKLQKVYADQIKSAEIEFEKAAVKSLKDVKVEFDKAAVKKVEDVKIELKKSPVEKIKDIQIEFKKEPVKVKDVEVEFKKVPIEKGKDIEIEFKKEPVKVKGGEIEFKKVPGEKIKDIELEIQKAAIDKLKDAELVLKKHYAAELKDAELALKKSLEQIKREDLKVLKEKIVSDVDIQSAAKAADIAKRDLEKALEAMRRLPGAVSEIDLDRMKQVQKRAIEEVDRTKRDVLDRTAKLKDDLKKQDFKDEVEKRLTELKRMVDLSTAKQKADTDKAPEKLIEKATQK
jgi:beta-lactamase regulating signal transducer with metallopeptidase domain